MRTLRSLSSFLLAASLTSLVATSASAQQYVGLVVTPATVRVLTGASTQLSVSAVRENGTRAQAPRVQFVSSDTAVADVDVTGRVVGKAPGIAVVTVSLEGIQRSVPVTVSASAQAPQRNEPQPQPRGGDRVSARPPADQAVRPKAADVRSILVKPGSFRLLPTERATVSVEFEYGDGTVGPPTGYTIAVFGSAALLDSASNTLTGVQAGAAVLGIRASDGPSVSVPIEVVPARIGFDRDTLFLATGQTDTVRVLTREDVPRQLSGLVWRVTNRQVLSQADSGSGVVRAVGVGASDLIVDGYGVTLRLPVVGHAPVSALKRVGAEGSVFTLPVGLTARVGALPVDVAGKQVEGAPVRWEVADTSVAVYEPSSQILTGRRAGSTTITARTPGAAAATWSVSVADARFQLDWNERYLRLGEEKQLRGLWIGPRGDTIRATRALLWSSPNRNTATVSDSGVVLGVARGVAVVRGTFDSRYGAEATISVTGDMLLSIDYGRDSVATADFQIPERRLSPISPLTGGMEPVWSSGRDRIAFVRRLPSKRLFSVNQYDISSGEVVSDTITSDEQALALWLDDHHRLGSFTRRSSVTQLGTHTGPDSVLRNLFAKGTLRHVTKRPGHDEFFAVMEENRWRRIVRFTTSDTATQLVAEKVSPIEKLQVMEDGTMFILADTSSGKGRYAVLRRSLNGEEVLDIALPVPSAQWRTFAVSHDAAFVFLVVDTPQSRRGSILYRVDVKSKEVTELLRLETAKITWLAI